MTDFMRFPGGKAKALTFSYDDGPREDLPLVEIFKKYGMHGTFNLNSGLYGTTGWYLTEQEIKDLYLPAGQELACHMLTHPFPTRLTAPRLVYEITEDRRRLEALTDGIVCGMAYPYGDYNAETIALLKTAGIAYARTTRSTERFSLPENFLELHPTCHHNHERLFDLADTFFAAQPDEGAHGRDPLLFYVWGHSFEFSENNNWERIERFCEKTAGHDDVWYATNGEICAYVTAARGLQFSLDGTMVHNPAALDVWIDHAKRLYHIPAGATVKL